MKIVDIKTYLMHAGPPGHTGWAKRNWLFLKVFTDEGVYGVGEASGWPRVVETAIQDLTPILVSEDPKAYREAVAEDAVSHDGSRHDGYCR